MRNRNKHYDRRPKQKYSLFAFTFCARGGGLGHMNLQPTPPFYHTPSYPPEMMKVSIVVVTKGDFCPSGMCRLNAITCYTDVRDIVVAGQNDVGQISVTSSFPSVTSQHISNTSYTYLTAFMISS